MFDQINMEIVNERIDFAVDSKGVFEENSLPDLQTKGVTALCKILNERQYAYLADEVGMGKTYQALGVISMLLAEKKDAKVLVITPNEAVQHNWESEIGNFNDKNLKNKNIKLSAKLFHPIKMIKSHINGEIKVNICIVRLTSFSTIGEHVVGHDKRINSESFLVSELAKGLNEITSVTNEELEKKIENEHEDIIEIKDKEKIKANDSIQSEEAGEICGRILREYTPRFDLVIVDEAQNLRNENNATVFFNSWMGLKRWKREAQYPERKYLLMSATPAHRGVESLKSQLEYFEHEDFFEKKKIDHDYLKKFLIRRLRTYNGENKYQVRQVNAEDVIKDDDSQRALEQRLFIALLQSRLSQLQGAGKNNATFKIGFLETFESFIPTKKGEDNKETGEVNQEFNNGGSRKEDEKGPAPDKKLLIQLSESYDREFNINESDKSSNVDSYNSRFNKSAPHPKLDYMNNETRDLLKTNFSEAAIIPSSLPDKAIVFVRRLASVNELVYRLNICYEKEIVDYWSNELFGKGRIASIKEIKNAFQKMYNGIDNHEDNELVDANDSNADENTDNVAKSDLLSWMAIKKNDKSGKKRNDDNDKYDAVSLFKKSMMRNKTRSFWFEENYYRTTYWNRNYGKRVDKIVNSEFINEVNHFINMDVERYISVTSNKKKKYNTSELLLLCCYLAFKQENNEKADKLFVFFDLGRSKGNGNDSKDKWVDKRIVKKLLLQTSIWNDLKEKHYIPSDFFVDSFENQYAIKAMIEKYLKSSEAVLELLFCVCKYSGPGMRDKICEKVVYRLFKEKKRYGKRILELINNRKNVIKQIIGKNAVKCDFDPAFMNLQQWVAPAVGGKKGGNEALIKRFNTPFYPDIIVCTDVLKEGINLHLFCNRVYHYGLAWSPGDLEQRVGRVDRVFGKVHRERNRINNKTTPNDNAFIKIFYPFMGKSIDEHQLRRVLQFKLSADPLMDSSEGNRKEIDAYSDELIPIKDLVDYKPPESEITNFPYSGEVFWGSDNVGD